jgi:hypothetical protein
VNVSYLLLCPGGVQQGGEGCVLDNLRSVNMFRRVPLVRDGGWVGCEVSQTCWSEWSVPVSTALFERAIVMIVCRPSFSGQEQRIWGGGRFWALPQLFIGGGVARRVGLASWSGSILRGNPLRIRNGEGVLKIQIPVAAYSSCP